VKREDGLPVMVSPGVVPEDVMTELAAAGADWYACYQETHTRDLYARLRLRQDYDERAAARGAAARSGLLVEDGMLLGVGETVADRATSILEMRRQPLAQVRVMSLVPQPGTPLAARPSPAVLEEQVVIAVMRLAMPDRLIPASLDVEGIAGLEARLEAGANVVTSIVPPASGLAGVSQAELDIDAGLRTVDGVAEHLPALGLEVAGVGEYADWVSAARARQSATIAV
jgi:methylornithine synthase